MKQSLPPPLTPCASSLVNEAFPTVAEQREKPRDFAALYRATLAPLRRYLTRLLGNPSEAQDIAHDAYVRVFPRPNQAAPDQPEAVLFTTARRLAINRLKRRSVSPLVPQSSDVEAASSSPGVAQQVMARQELRLLEEAISKLPEGCRGVLLLRKVELLSHKEIAERLGIAVSTVEKQHVRALRLLRAAFPPETREIPGMNASARLSKEGS